MLPLLLTLIAIFGLFLAKRFAKSESATISAVGAALRELCVAMAVTGVLFTLLEVWLLQSTDLPSDTTTVAALEVALHTLRRWVTALRVSPWIQVALLALMSGLAAVKIIQPHLLSKASNLFAWISRAYAITTILVSLTFFGGAVATGVAARTAHLSAQIDAIGKAYEEVAQVVAASARTSAVRQLLEQSSLTPVLENLARVHHDLRARAADAELWRKTIRSAETLPVSFQEAGARESATSKVLRSVQDATPQDSATLSREAFRSRTLADARQLSAAVKTQAASASATLSQDAQVLLKALVSATYGSTIKPEFAASIAEHAAGALGELLGVFSDPVLHQPIKRAVTSASSSFLARFIANGDSASTWSTDLHSFLSEELTSVTERLRPRAPQLAAAVSNDRDHLDALGRRVREDASSLAKRQLALEWDRIQDRAEAVALPDEVRSGLRAFIRRARSKAADGADTVAGLADRMQMTSQIAGVVIGQSEVSSLIQLEHSVSGTDELASSIKSVRLGDEEFGSKWGRMRHRLQAAVEAGEVKAKPSQLELMKAALSRWIGHRDEKALNVQLSALRAHADWDKLFLDYTRSDPDMAALWGFAVISFSSDTDLQPFIKDRIPGELARFEMKNGTLSTTERMQALKALVEHGAKPVDGYRYFVSSLGTWSDDEASQFFGSEPVNESVSKICPVGN